MTTYRPSQPLHPLSLLAQLSSRQATGCLKVTVNQSVWFLLVEQGKLSFATTSHQAFDRLDAHLRRLSSQIPTLASAVRVQVRLLFDKAEVPLENCPDYHAICWLVEQNHLPSHQATLLVEALTKEVLEGFLTVQEGASELIETDVLAGMPKLCQLSMRTTVEECYNRLKQRQNSGQPATLPNSLNQRNGDYRNQTVATPALPISVLNPAESSLGLAGSAPAQTPPIPSRKTTYTIACIDDSPTILRAINEFLDDKMFSVLMISDPVKALMQVIRNKPDLILLDVTMPNLDGYELCSLLRRHPDFKNVPIIMVTGNTGLIDRAKAKLVRASGYLTKPFNQSDLLKIIFKHLS